MTIIKFFRKKSISIKSLNKYLPKRFSVLLPNNLYSGYGDCYTNELELLWEIEKYGLKYIEDIERIIPKDLIEILLEFKKKTNYLGLMRYIMITSDYERYFNGLQNGFIQWDLSSLHNDDNIFSYYKLTPDIIDLKIKEQELAEQNLKAKKKCV